MTEGFVLVDVCNMSSTVIATFLFTVSKLKSFIWLFVVLMHLTPSKSNAVSPVTLQYIKVSVDYYVKILEKSRDMHPSFPMALVVVNEIVKRCSVELYKVLSLALAANEVPVRSSGVITELTVF